ncbi:MAG TPA: hypothetical protein VG899_16485 [Mycobacteriales bacterium]|nr:hypothetical protein [Mycobacteriales bacterium]HWB67205.1 hypothetical protein [Mycobacteriales bacterium]
MTKSILVVKTAPDSPEGAAAYNDWYDNTHLGELLAIEGCTSARRFGPDGDTYLALYEFDCDADTAKARFGAAFANMAPPVNVRMDPPPSMEFYDVYGG